MRRILFSLAQGDLHHARPSPSLLPNRSSTARARKLRVGAAQIGAVFREESREHIVERHIALLEEAARREVEVIVYPECSLTTYFPRLLLLDSEIDRFFESNDPVHPENQPSTQ